MVEEETAWVNEVLSSPEIQAKRESISAHDGLAERTLAVKELEDRALLLIARRDGTLGITQIPTRSLDEPCELDEVE